MRVRHFNIAGVAWSNFKHGINTNGRIAIKNESLSIDVVNVSAGVDEAIVALQERGGVVVVVGGGFRGETFERGGWGCRLRGCAHHVFAGRSVTSEAGGWSRSRGRGRGSRAT